VVSDNQNVHQLLHRLVFEQTITNLRYRGQFYPSTKKQMYSCTDLDTKDDVLLQKQNFAQPYRCKELEAITKFYTVHSMPVR
jgi:hypothetical protein